MTVSAAADEITDQLRRRGGASGQSHVPAAPHDIGACAPDLRQILRTWRQSPGGKSGAFVYRLGRALRTLQTRLTAVVSYGCALFVNLRA